jgi:formamidopyrimidine-DNA glycosylase
MLSRAAPRNNGMVPELPDLRILEEAFTAALIGRELQAVTVTQPLVVRGTAAELRACQGGVLRQVEQRGKFLTFGFERGGRLVVNAMLTGRLGLAAPGSTAFGSTAVVLTLGPRSVPPPSAGVAAWTLGASWLPPDDRPVELRYRDPRRMGKVYVLPEGVEREVAGWESLGPDADDPELGLAVWQERLRRHDGELGNLLKNQAFVAGIGNAYSDEILWAAGLGPFRRRATLAEEETERLWQATGETLHWAIDELRVRVPPRFEQQQRDFLRVHLKGGRPCPRCGATLAEVSPGGFTTTWCRACQP